jgi:hypothetical protein
MGGNGMGRNDGKIYGKPHAVNVFAEFAGLKMAPWDNRG